MESLSVVVPVRGASPAFRRCLDALQSLEPAPWEILIINDGADPLVRELCRRRQLSCFETQQIQGPAAARNLGAAHATGSLLFFVDSDVVAPVDAVHRVTEAFQNSPHLAALFGSYDDSPSEPNFFSQFKNLYHHYTHQRGARRAETFWAGLGAIRRDTFFGVGGFDTRFACPSVEDIELGYRIRSHGFEIELMRELQGKHLKRWTLASVLVTDLLQRAIPWTELMWAHPERKADLNVRPREMFSAFLALAAIPATQGPTGLMVGICLAWVALHLPLYTFFWKRRGTLFLVPAVLWHWFYFIYSVVGFVWGSLQYWSRRPMAPLLFREVPA